MHCLILHSLTGHVDGVGMALNSLASKSSVFSTFYPVVAPFKNVKAPKPKMCKKKKKSYFSLGNLSLGCLTELNFTP